MGQFKATNIVTNKNYSESEMAPNAEEELLAVKPWGPQTEKQERLRPPTYNAEDYAAALRRWGRRPAPPHLETQNGTLVSTTSSSSGYASGSGEMTLRQFTSVSELLNKLRADLRLAFPSFVQEFASSPADGITLLLETLRGVQVAQNTPPSGQTGPRIGTRRAALDELGCVECLAACGERCADAPRLLIEAQPGLLALAVCLTSSLNRSRVLALQLLTRVCQAPGGHAAVSEAVSTLRLRYGEGGRFRFLAGALLAPSAAIVLRVAGVSFLNAFIKSAPRAQTKLYIQAEACEAGLEPKVLQEWLTNIDHTTVEESLTDLLRKEVNRWTRNCVDVEGLQKRASRAEETCRMLGKKILSLQNQIENLQVENMNGYNTSRDLLVNNNNNNNNNNNHNNNNKNVNHNHHHHHHHHQVLRNEKRSKKNSSNIDDEGISSSERSSTPEELKRADENDDDGGGMNNILKISSLDNDQETTIDDVIEELRIIVKDAEEEYEDKTNTSKIKNLIDNNYEDGKKKLKKTSKYSLQGSNGTTTTSCSESTKICDQTPAITYFGNRIDKEDYNNYADSSAVTRKLSSNNSSISKLSNDGSLKILVKGPDLEEAIVPAILHPQPPKRSPPCLTGILSSRNCAFTDTEEAYNSSPGDEIEEETLGDGSDSLLSASRLKYTQNEAPNTQVQLNGALLENYVTKMNDQGLIKSSKSCENLTDSKKTIRNYNSSLVMSENSVAKSYEGRQRVSNNANFEKAYSLQSSEQSHKHGGMMKYRSEIEKRKILRRTSSQDRLDEKFNGNNHQKLKRSESGIESRIRKFESLNSFENLSLQSLSRPGSVDSFNRPLLFDDNSGIKGKIMRRSESFHHISLGKKESSKRSAGGSDSGLFYVTNFDLEPVITQQIKPESLKSSNMLTKSLDRIDEGLDSMVDIILTEEKHDWKIGSEKNRSKIDKQLMKQDKEKEKRLKNGKTRIEKHVKNDKLLKNDEFYNSFAKTAAAAAAAAAAGIKHLRNDELYSDKPTLQMQKHWSYQTELDNARKSITATENALGILSISSASAAAVGSNKLKHQESFCLEKNIVGNKFSIGSNHESGIYLPGRSYDAFGLSKSRFNAGKYSGNNLSTRDNNGCNNSLIITSATATAAASGNRNSVISPTSNHGKVTDVLSGLY